MNKRNLLKTALATVVFGLGVATSQLSLAAPQTLHVGIMSGEDEDVWRVVAANAAKQGLTIKITTFSDYTQPNEALSEHDLTPIRSSTSRISMRRSRHVATRSCRWVLPTCSRLACTRAR